MTKESKELATAVKRNLERIEITAEDIKKHLCPTLTDKELFMAMGIIKNQNLDIFKREAHITKYKSKSTGEEKFAVIVGYEVFLKRAERTGKLDGWKVWIEGTKGKLIIYRKDWSKPFEWETDLTQFNKHQSTWNQIPDFMGKKITIKQGFAACFPDELGGLPYIQEEYDMYDMENANQEPKGKPIVDMPKELPQTNKPAEETKSEIEFDQAKDDTITGLYISADESQVTKSDKTKTIVADYVLAVSDHFEKVRVIGVKLSGLKTKETVLKFTGVKSKTVDGEIKLSAKEVIDVTAQ